MDKTELTNQVAHLFRISGYRVDTSIRLNHREIDIRAESTQGLIRQIILAECADYKNPVGIKKLQEDVTKLRSARETMQQNVLLMHVSRYGYSPDASGYAVERGISTYSFTTLTHQLVNFDAYIEAVENDRAKETILSEYQPTKINYDGKPMRHAKPAIDFITEWMAGPSRWLTILGDYGVGKSWMLKRFLYFGIEKYRQNPESFPLPFFVPLQRFTKSFDYRNLILGAFQYHGLAGVTYDAFEHLASAGRILFLFDSFDEMAQHLHRDTIRENLKELLVGMSGRSRAIMTSRPTYFESRAERLIAVEDAGSLTWHPLDRSAAERKVALSSFLSRSLETSQFARLMDLSASQRRTLFAVVLGAGSKSYKTLIGLLGRFEELGSISQRAVIARLLTTVAETLASGDAARTVEGYPLIPDDLQVLNQGKIFEIVVHNLLYRDEQIGSLSAGDRYLFLKSFAVYLQQFGQDAFARPDEIRAIVQHVLSDKLKRADARQQLLEQYYRTCRRHSGLTTESQFQDNTGRLDLPVEDSDTTARVGFSHNSLREYLVADAFSDFLMRGSSFESLGTVSITEAVIGFFVDLTFYVPGLADRLAQVYVDCADSNLRETLFRLLFGLVNSSVKDSIHYLGSPARITHLDLSGIDFSGFPLRDANFEGSIMPDTDFRNANLARACFDDSVLDGTMFDQANIESADFTNADIQSIFVFDEYNSRTSSMLTGKDARQWLFSHGARVFEWVDLNPLLGKPWYEAAREVTKTLERKIAGTHQDIALSKGTHLEYRGFAEDFVKHLRNSGVLEDLKKNRSGAMVVRVASDHREVIRRFNEDGDIDFVLQTFFDRFLDKHG